MRKKVFFAVFLSAFGFGCSAIMPYEEEPLCKIGKEGGYCGSVYDVYNESLNWSVERRKPVKLVPGVECDNCTPEEYERKIRSVMERRESQVKGFPAEE